MRSVTQHVDLGQALPVHRVQVPVQLVYVGGLVEGVEGVIEGVDGDHGVV